ncbi:hepatocyte growth factor-like protein [Gigantopelta aegis]|uniref:hepatocyte growth factor-like protein n=1 Tax=Gigantopelta aegis TaxID=1735272 RepID=UPI001B88CCD2|nr:hepatocyte growth factor-like protein [Gigantopelta aegis]
MSQQSIKRKFIPVLSSEQTCSSRATHLERVLYYEDLHVTEMDLYNASKVAFDECRSVCAEDLTCRAFIADNRQGTCAWFRDKSSSSSNSDDVIRQIDFMEYETQGFCATAPELECYRVVKGKAAYTGRRMTTTSGITCQRFDQQTPHGHSQTNPADFYVTSLSEVENFCRDPDGSKIAWCFTIDPDVRWGPCGIPLCI